MSEEEEFIPEIKVSKAKFFGISNKEGKTVYTKSTMTEDEKKLAEFMIKLSKENSYDTLTTIEITDKVKNNSFQLDFHFDDESIYPFTITKYRPTKYEITSQFIPCETLGFIRISK